MINDRHSHGRSTFEQDIKHVTDEVGESYASSKWNGCILYDTSTSEVAMQLARQIPFN